MAKSGEQLTRLWQKQGKFRTNNRVKSRRKSEHVVLAHQETSGKSLVVEDPDEEMPNVFEDLHIKDNLFTTEELRQVKSNLRVGKAAGLDNQPKKYSSRLTLCLDF